jgi:hypothetical protein
MDLQFPSPCNFTERCLVNEKVKVKVKQFLYRPRQALGVAKA